jgi:hypothetical protein
VVTAARLDRIEALARTLIDDYDLHGRWGWFGTPTQPYLSTRQHGRMFILGATVGHTHHRVLLDDGDGSWEVPCPDGEFGSCLAVVDVDETPVGSGAEPTGDHNADGEEVVVDYDEYLQRHALITFPSGKHAGMRSSAQIPVFEVCRDATSSADPRVYRPDVVGFRSAAAEWLAEMDAETVLALVELARRAPMQELRAEGEELK